MAKADGGINADRAWLGDAYASLIKACGSPRLAEKLLRETYDVASPGSWGYLRKDGDAADHEFWRDANFNFQENSARVGYTMFVAGPGVDNSVGPRSTEYYGVWVSRALLPYPSSHEVTDSVGPMLPADRRRKVGAKPKYDWDAIQAHCIQCFNDDGYPENVSEFCRDAIIPWCASRYGEGGTPDIETLRPLVAKWSLAWQRSLPPK